MVKTYNSPKETLGSFLLYTTDAVIKALKSMKRERDFLLLLFFCVNL